MPTYLDEEHKPNPYFITSLADNEIFVFGSNTTGRHGKGAARQARERFGAVNGIGEGLTGRCYALPTLDHKFQRVTDQALLKSRDLLYSTCALHPDKNFLLTKVGCGLAGFSESKMESLFHTHPDNLILPESWR